MPLESFRRSLIESRQLLEDVSGGPVFGYRSPCFSIGRILETAGNIVLDAGYLYDSSAHLPLHKCQVEGRVSRLAFQFSDGLWEFPLTTIFLMRRALSIGSSFYCRRLPTEVHRNLLNYAGRSSGGVHVYFHPNELAGEVTPLTRKLRYPRQFLFSGSERRGATRIRALLADRVYSPIEHILDARSQRSVVTESFAGHES
jgi:hypothetical protein